MSSKQEKSHSPLLISLLFLATNLLGLIPHACQSTSSSNNSSNQVNATNSGLTLISATTARPNYLETGRQITGILDRFMSLGYDKRVRPNYGGPPVEVNVTMRILSISSVSEVMMDFTADFYFRQTWHDPRLSFKKLGDIQTLYVGAEVSKKIWLPDTFFGNEKLAYFHEATTPNVFLRIDHSGEVYRSIRLTVTSSCPMNLQYFPMDRQRCTIEAESYGYNIKDIIYRWARKDTAVERDKEISLPQFDIVKTVQKYRLEELSSGTYSRLIAEIHFARRMGYYLIQIYIPSSLIVVISWVSFWLHRNASPARVQLGVTTVLTMTTLMSSTNAALPKISYVKSIDIFLGTCFIMVFAALLEYATVGYLGKRIAMRKAQVQHAQSQAQARIFAQLQAQGAQGDPIAPTAASTLLGETPVGTNFHATNSLLQAAATAAVATGIPVTQPSKTAASNLHNNNSSNLQSNLLLSSNSNILATGHLHQQTPFDLQQSFAAAPNHNITQTSPSFNDDGGGNFNTYLANLAASGKLDTPPPIAPERSSGSCGCNYSNSNNNNGSLQKAAKHQVNNRIRCQHCSASPLSSLSQLQHQHHCGSRNNSGECCCSNCHTHQIPSPNTHCCCGSHKSQILSREKRSGDNQQHCSVVHQCQCHVNLNSHNHNQCHKHDQDLHQHSLYNHDQHNHNHNHHHNLNLNLNHRSNEHENLNSSHTLPRNITFMGGHNATGNHNDKLNNTENNSISPNTTAAEHNLRQRQQQQQQQVNWLNNTQDNNSLPPSYCGKAASAATAAAATFVNLHRKQKGLPPSTNPNFAQFAWMGQHNRSLETIFGIRPSDIDKYSRVVFPVCFVCFQLCYWLTYLHISTFLETNGLDNKQS